MKKIIAIMFTAITMFVLIEQATNLTNLAAGISIVLGQEELCLSIQDKDSGKPPITYCGLDEESAQDLETACKENNDQVKCTSH